MTGENIHRSRHTIRLMMSLCVVLNSLVIISSTNNSVEARASTLASKKPPFNGSIFGKRSSPTLQLVGAMDSSSTPPTTKPLENFDSVSPGTAYLVSNSKSNSNNYNDNNSNNVNNNNNYIDVSKLMMLLNHQQQMRNEAVLRALISRCLFQRDLLLQVSVDTRTIASSVCEQLLAAFQLDLLE